MPSSCCAVGCTNRQKAGSEVKFFRIPTNPDQRHRWIAAIRRVNWIPKEHDRLCSQHFIEGKPSKDSTNPDYVPTLFTYAPPSKTSDAAVQQKVARHQRLQERKENANRIASAQALLTLGVDIPEEIPGVATQTQRATCTEAGTQTELTLPYMDSLIVTNQVLCRATDELRANLSKREIECDTLSSKIVSLTEDINHLQSKINKLEEDNSVLSEEVARTVLKCKFLEKDDKKTQFYTGLPNYATFLAVHSATSVRIRRRNTKLSSMDELLLTLVKLRRNFKFTDLAYRFNIARTCATNIFHAWLDALYISLGGLVQWPETDVCQLPPVFQNSLFRKVKCVIDCTEIFIERPSNLKARAQTYSNYKRHNTIKVLIGVSPTGCVTYISECWGGRVSDKQITLESGFLDKLSPGDVVLADRGFNIEEEFAVRGSKLIVPAYTRGKKQLSKKEVEESRMMARARIHVERVIGRLKDFEIMKGTLPVRLVKKDNASVTTSDKIVRVVAALINTNGPLL